MRNSSPGEISDVAKSIHATQINEKSVISYIGNRSFHDHALFQGGAHCITHFFPFFFKDGTPRNNDIISFSVKFKNFEGEGLANESIKVLHWAQVNLRIGKESRHSDIN